MRQPFYNLFWALGINKSLFCKYFLAVALRWLVALERSTFFSYVLIWYLAAANSSCHRLTVKFFSVCIMDWLSAFHIAECTASSVQYLDKAGPGFTLQCCHTCLLLLVLGLYTHSSYSFSFQCAVIRTTVLDMTYNPPVQLWAFSQVGEWHTSMICWRDVQSGFCYLLTELPAPNLHKEKKGNARACTLTTHGLFGHVNAQLGFIVHTWNISE